jgi:hypothetical protein
MLSRERGEDDESKAQLRRYIINEVLHNNV